jgi:predicted Fe-Mo cluster-binding NifX family protein
MKIAIATENGNVSAHFGRCPLYTIADVDKGRISRVEEIPNPGHEPGFLPRFLAQKGIDIIISGGMGPRAQDLFAQNSIQTITGVRGEVKSILNQYVNGRLSAGPDLCDHPHETCAEEHHISKKPLPRDLILCLTAEGPTLQDKLDPRFGRAAYFLFIKPGTDLVEAIENPNIEAAHGAGIQSAQLIANKKTGILITGRVGPKARQVLERSDIRIIFKGEGTVQEALSGIAAELS